MNPQQPFQTPDQQGPDSKRERVNSMWKVVSYIYILVALGISFYWEWKNSGLCIIIREWQGSIIDDGYYPALDIMGSLVALLIPLFIAKVIVEKVTGVKIDNPNYRRR